MALTAAVARPHDLVSFTAAPYEATVPDWVERNGGACWAVVRRSRPRGAAALAVGLRGRTRTERRAIEVAETDVLALVTPMSLLPGALRPGLAPRMAGAIEHLLALDWSVGRPWGPTGSVGYQLATGVDATHDDSDLDLVVVAEHRMEPDAARSLLFALTGVPVRVDCLLETPAGAVALVEWAESSGGHVLLRTADGPRLTRDPWFVAEAG